MGTLMVICVLACGDAEYQDGSSVSETAHIMSARKHMGPQWQKMTPFKYPHRFASSKTCFFKEDIIYYHLWEMTPLLRNWWGQSSDYFPASRQSPALWDQVSAWVSASHWDIKHNRKKQNPYYVWSFNCFKKKAQNNQQKKILEFLWSLIIFF